MSKESDQQRDQFSATFKRQRAEAAAAAAAMAKAAIPPRVKPVRITVDLDPVLHRELKVWSAQAGISKQSDIVRVLLHLLVSGEDAELADTVRRQLLTRRIE
jgi:DUF1365 family protein